MMKISLDCQPRNWLPAVATNLVFAVVLVPSLQGQGPVIPSIPTAPGIPTAPIAPTNPTQPGNSGGGATQTGTIGDLGDGAVDPRNVDIGTSDNIRNQGFVGATAPGIQNFGFIGAASENNGPPLMPDATFGGGVNGISSGSSVGRGAGNINTFGGQQGFGPVANQNGFSINRRNLRTRLQANFLSPQIPPATIANRFSNGFFRLPQSQQFTGQCQITVNDRTATITGFVNSKTDSDNLVRQLRLEPGIYKIDNRLQIKDQ